jgi:hypothetical protein
LAALSFKKKIAFLPLSVAQLVGAVLFVYKSVLCFLSAIVFYKKRIAFFISAIAQKFLAALLFHPSTLFIHP